MSIRININIRVAVSLFAILVCLIGCKKETGTKNQLSDRLVVVKKGDFPVLFRIDGQLDAIRNHEIAFKGKRGARELKLTFVLPEHTSVSSNDVVFRISDEFFKRQESDLLRKIQSAEQNYEMAQHDLEMIRADNVNDLKAALDNLKSATDAYGKYENEDASKRKKELQQNVQAKIALVQKSEGELQKARKTLTDVYSMEEQVVKEATRKVAEAESTLKAAAQAVDSAFYDLRVFKRYEHPQKLTTLQEAVKRNTLTVQRGVVNNETRLTKKQIELANSCASLEDFKYELKEIQEDMARLEMRTPASGTLFYGNPDGRNQWSRQSEDLKVGTDVSIGQVLAFIPNVDKFLVKISIPEEFRSRIKTGLKAHIKAKAIPDLALNGEVTSIASAATTTVFWDPSSPKVYTTKISTDSADRRLIPGMTVQVEVIVETVKQVLYLPVEAVYNREGQAYVKVDKGLHVEERKVQTGRFSVDYIEICEGIGEGESVLLIRTSS